MVLTYLFYIILKPGIEDVLLKNFGKCISADFINDGVRVRYHKKEFKYKFFYAGDYYAGNSLETDEGKVGSKVCVLFLKTLPSINRPLKYFNDSKKQCECD